MSNDELLKVKKRPKRYFRLEDKKNFYLQWQASGLGKSQFCAEHGLVLSAFSNWCRQLYPNKPIKSPKDHWIPIIPNETSLVSKTETSQINIKNRNTNILLFALCCLLLLRGVFDAIAIIW